MEGRLPETVLKGGAGSGVLRPRLVTAGSGGPGHRPPGMTTWLRGARCTDPEAMPEMEARPPAENRHGGAPRGERPASWDAPRLTRADPSRLANATTDIVRLSALRPPLLRGRARMDKGPTRAQQRAAGTNNTALFDIVRLGRRNGSLARRDRVTRLILRRREAPSRRMGGPARLAWPHASRRSLRSLLSMRTPAIATQDQPASRFAR